MATIDVKAEMDRVQEIIDYITRSGFWFSVHFDGGGSLQFFPYRLEVLWAKPNVGPNGKVKSWIYAILMIDRCFADFGASMHGNHMHYVEKIEWRKDASDRIYAARLYDDNDNKININEIDASEHPDIAGEWETYVKQLAEQPDRVDVCLETIRWEFMEMVEDHFS